jgi:hypothetical protein
VALNKKILLVAFSPSQKNHNERLAKILCGTFTVMQHSFLETKIQSEREFKTKLVISKLLHSLSVPTVWALIVVKMFFSRFIYRNKPHNFLTEAIESYFGSERGLISLSLHFNRTLRQQKFRVLRAKELVESAVKDEIDCVLLPEDNNFYASGIIIGGLHEQGLKVGIIDYTIGKEAEFELSRKSLVPDRSILSYAILARFLLDRGAQERWFKTKEFINCFPGSLETVSHHSLTPSFLSGLADFYLTSDESEMSYLKKVANENAHVCQIEPVELTLAKMHPNFVTTRNVFGVFLPPNQFSDPSVVSRMSSSYPKEYKEVILRILDEAEEVCGSQEEIVVFPHPRTYAAEPDLIVEVSERFKISDDFAKYLSRMRCALIFSSAVFSALLAANIKVFNFDLYHYGYVGVFPVGCSNFIEIHEICEIRNFPHDAEPGSLTPNFTKDTITEFLKSYL